jgi:hypothetical protein
MSTESTEPVEPTPAADHDEAPAKKNWLKFVIVGVLAVVLIGGAVYAFNQFGSGAASADVGDCASATDQGDNKWEVKVLDCGDDNASYKVAKILPSADDVCPEEGLYEPIGTDSKQLCLMPNFVEGACYTPSDDGATFKKGGCTGDAVIKVTKRIEGNPETVECPEGSSDLRFSEPAVIFCLGVGGENP